MGLLQPRFIASFSTMKMIAPERATGSYAAPGVRIRSGSSCGGGGGSGVGGNSAVAGSPITGG